MVDLYVMQKSCFEIQEIMPTGIESSDKNLVLKHSVLIEWTNLYTRACPDHNAWLSQIVWVYTVPKMDMTQILCTNLLIYQLRNRKDKRTTKALITISKCCEKTARVDRLIRAFAIKILPANLVSYYGPNVVSGSNKAPKGETK